MNEVFLIDTAIAKLDFVPKYNKSIKINNKIYVRCHSYFINIYNNIPITTPDNITNTTITEPTPTTVTEPTPTTVTEPTPTTVTEPTPITVAEPTPTTVTEPTPNNTITTPETTTTITEPTPTTVTEPTPTTVTEPTSTTVAEPISITVTEPTSTTTAEPTSTIVAEPILNTTVAEPVLNTTVAEPISTTTAIIDIDEEIKIKAIEYIQPKIYIDNNYNPISEKFNDIIDNTNSNLYICITHADIIIDLDKKNYKIYKVNFNIRKPTEDRYNLFEKIINNINTYYFNINYDVMYITYHLSDVINSIYYINTMSISLTDNIDAINIDLIQHTATSISQEIDYKPFIFNEVKLKVVDINF